MKKMLVAMIMAVAMLVVPNTAKADILTNKELGITDKFCGTVTYDDENGILTVENARYTPSSMLSRELNAIVAKGTCSVYFSISGNNTTKTIDVSGTSIPLLNTIDYNFTTAGSVKMPFKWSCPKDLKGWALNATDTDGNKLVTDQNPLDDAVELTNDMFNFPSVVYASEIGSTTDEWHDAGDYSGKGFSAKSAYTFKYTASSYLAVDYDANGMFVQFFVDSDGGFTSYGHISSGRISFVDDVTVTNAPSTNEPSDDSDSDDKEDKESKKEESKKEETTKKENTTKKVVALAKNKTFTVSGYKYKVTKSSTKNGEVQLVKGKNTKNASVRDTVTYKKVTYKVTSIGSKAFQKCTKVQKVTIGKNVQSIGSKAFYGCRGLKTVTMKSTKLTSIGSQAFQGCTKLTSISLPKTVKTIGKQAFYGCKNLKTVTIKSTKLTSVGSKAFTGCNKKLTVKVAKAKYSKYKSALKKAGAKTIKKF